MHYSGADIQCIAHGQALHDRLELPCIYRWKCCSAFRWMYRVLTHSALGEFGFERNECRLERWIYLRVDSFASLLEWQKESEATWDAIDVCREGVIKAHNRRIRSLCWTFALIHLSISSWCLVIIHILLMCPMHFYMHRYARCEGPFKRHPYNLYGCSCPCHWQKFKHIDHSTKGSINLMVSYFDSTFSKWILYSFH